MHEDVEQSAGGRFPGQRVILPLSDAARASLAAVRAAQEAARERARRQTWRTRAWLGGIVGGLAFGVVVFGARPVARHKASTTSSAPAVTPAKAPVATTTTTAPGSVSTSASPPTTEPASAMAVASGGKPSAAQIPAVPVDNATAQASEDACSENFGQRRWRLSIEECTLAFQAHPTDGSIALRIAHSYHARARLPEAEDWANRALALDSTLAEAFVIVAHAETHAGHADESFEAYRRYLALAPRGWHASEARAAVRAHNRVQHARLGFPSPRAEHTAIPVSLVNE